MPNGHPDWSKKELPKLKVFFGRIAPVLKKFAKDHNLKIEKYHHQCPSWRLFFRHPKGGLGQLNAHKLLGDNEHVFISGIWSLDDYDSCTRSSKVSHDIKLSLDDPTLYKSLYELLGLVLSWRKEDLMPGRDKIEGWKEIPKEKFYSQYEKYPIPKLD